MIGIGPALRVVRNRPNFSKAEHLRTGGWRMSTLMRVLALAVVTLGLTSAAATAAPPERVEIDATFPDSATPSSSRKLSAKPTEQLPTSSRRGHRARRSWR